MPWNPWWLTAAKDGERHTEKGRTTKAGRGLWKGVGRSGSWMLPWHRKCTHMANLIQLCASNQMHFVHTVQRSLFKSFSYASIKLWKYILLKTHNNTYHLQVCMGLPYCFKHFWTTDEQKLRYLTVILNYLSVITNEIWNVCFSTRMILLRNYVLAWFAHFSWLAFFVYFLCDYASISFQTFLCKYTYFS